MLKRPAPPEVGAVSDKPVSVGFVSAQMATLLDPTLPPRHGGAELQVLRLAEEFGRDERFSVHLMVDEIPQHAIAIPGVELHRFPPAVQRGPGRVRALGNIVRWILAVGGMDCDWLVQMTGNPLTFHIAIARLVLRKRMVFLLSTDADVDGSLWAGSPKVRRQYLWARRHADLTMAQHQGQQEALRAMGIESYILPSGFPIRPDSGCAERDIVLWVASCQPLKQPELFMELAQRHSGTPFVMITTPRVRPYFEETCARAAGVPNLTVIHGVPDLRPYYDRAIALVNTSTVEGFPNTFLEAAMSSTPIVSLNVDPDHMLSQAGAGIAGLGEFDRVVEGVGQLIRNPSERARRGAAARRYVVERHDVKQTASILKRLILEFRTSGPM